jgi:drug/metabolite transporter (DMT)-like permease
LRRLSVETQAKLACAYSGLVWGLFWLPLRQLEASGVPGLWANLVFYVAPLFFVAPAVAFRRAEIVEGGSDLQLKGLISALSLVAYSVAILTTDIVRAILLFYLTPIWSALLARAVLGEPITRVRWVAMALGLAGLIVILSDGTRSIPLPSNAGDWLALSSGLGWAVAAVLLRTGKDLHALDLCCTNFLWSAAIAVIFVIVFASTAGPMPPLQTMAGTLPWLLPVMLLVVVTGMYATMWGAPKLNPAVVGLLFMTEISVGAVTAALWAGEPFGPREIAGVILISAAGVAESLWDLWVKPRLERA